MRVLGLDLSLSATGYVLLDDDRVLWHGTVSPQTRDAQRLAQFEDWLVAALGNMGPIDYAGIEGYSYGSPQGRTHAYAIGELGGVVKLALWQAGITTFLVPPASWKKQLLGNGRLAKDQVRLECYKRYGVEFAAQDTLDAWAVAMTTRRWLLGLDKPHPKARKRIPPRLATSQQATEGAGDEEGAATLAGSTQSAPA